MHVYVCARIVHCTYDVFQTKNIIPIMASTHFFGLFIAVFCQCGCLEEAMAAFEKAGCWRQVFTVTAQLNKAPAERMAIARRIASQSNTIMQCKTWETDVSLDTFHM